MEHCTFCGSELPRFAQFCGYCGRPVSDTMREMPTSRSSYPGVDVLVGDGPTAISGASVLRSGEQENITSGHMWSQGEGTQHIPDIPVSGIDEEEDEEKEQRRRALLGLPLLGALADAPPPAVPMVQGTPSLGGVPTVPGSSGAPSSAPGIFGPGSSAPAPFGSTPAPYTSLPHPGSWPPVHPTTGPSSPSLPPGHTSPGSSPGTGPTTGTSGYPGSGSTGGGGCALTTLILAVICLVLIGTVGGLFFGLPPGISIVGSSDVVMGGRLHVHGSHFVPGSSITLTLDDHIPLFSAGRNIAGEAYSTSQAALQMTVAGQFTSTGSAIKADGSGSFDIIIPVSTIWNLGPHTLRATESVSSRSAVLHFRVDAPPAKLVATPSTLDFSQLEVGGKAVMSVVVNNGGGQPLSWKATTNGTPWLKIDPDNGNMQVGAAAQFVYVKADASHLKVGVYSATLTISSNGGNAQVDVKLQVIPQSPRPRAKLSVAPTTLDFGTLDVGKQLTKTLTVSNSGNAALNWKADTGSADWVTLDTSSQTIQSGGLPDKVNVSVDTTNLAAGYQSATLTFTSNGGKAQVTITVFVTVPQTQQLCTLSAPSATSEIFNAKMGSNPNSQTFSIGVTGACANGVTITPTATVATGSGWLAVTPSSATSTGGSATFTVNVTSADLAPGTYTGSITLAAVSGNTAIIASPQKVSVTLNVTEVPPVLAVSPGSLTFDLSNGDKATSQSFKISNTGGAPLDWTATLDANAPSFVTLSSGASTGLALGPSTTVNVNVNPSGVEAGKYVATVTVSATDPATGKTVSGSPATVSVTINITASPSMQLSTNSLTLTPGNCEYKASGNVTITNTGGGTLGWTVGDPVYASGQPTGWLSVLPSGQGSGDATLTFTADGTVSGLNYDVTYTATVTITPSVGDPQTVTVSFTFSCLK